MGTAQRVAKFENAVNEAGFSTAMIQEYHAAVSARLGEVLAKITSKAHAQAVYDVTTNFPGGIIERIDQDRAEQIVTEATVCALATVLEWDITAARCAAVDLLNDVNDHDAANMLEALPA